MRRREVISRYILATIFIAGAFLHLFNPEISDGFIPNQLPKPAVHFLAAAIELGIGLLLLSKKYSTWGAGIGFLVLMAFLPLHIIDVFRSEPVIGSHLLAWVRVPIQLLLIYLCLMLIKRRGGR
jgi:uncharacterized membrane protein